MAWTPRFEGMILWWVILSVIVSLLVAYRMDNLSISRATVSLQEWICYIQRVN